MLFRSVIAPTAKGPTWSLLDPDTDGANIEAIVAQVGEDWNIDPGKRLLTGMSDGGTFTLLAGLDAGALSQYLGDARLAPLTPFTCVSAKKLAQEIRQVHKDGYSVVNQELEIGLRSIGVPVLDRGGRTAAAISFSIRDPYYPVEKLVRQLLAPLRKASLEITGSFPT